MNGMLDAKKTLEELALNSGKRIFSCYNKVWMSGTFDSEFSYSHTYGAEKYYMTSVSVERLSGVIDHIPIVVPESMVVENANENMHVEVGGELRVHRMLDMERNQCYSKMCVFPKVLNVYDNEEDLFLPNANIVYIEGIIYRSPEYRRTPLGRTITELFVKVNRFNDNGIEVSDKLVCITWEKVAQFVRNLKVGDRVQVYGRIQSREYFKKLYLNSDEVEYRTTYEISAYNVSKVNI